ncbi:hypothetical protein GQ53DRAFT_746261 [Thozetella sp. PMI_491]|nr:hypothetical protein GQ53DRAFT_746261 [Thozetella sp. PMI_491]
MVSEPRGSKLVLTPMLNADGILVFDAYFFVAATREDPSVTQKAGRDVDQWRGRNTTGRS